MTEQPDTAVIRESILYYRDASVWQAQVRDLCDALDAARAERDEWKANTLANEALYLKHFNRAEAAEKNTKKWQQELARQRTARGVAEARIRAAVGAWESGDGPTGHTARQMHRALVVAP